MREIKQGFSLVEAAIVLGIVGLVVGGIWVAAASVSYSRQKQEYFQGFLTLQANAQQYLTQSTNCTNGNYISYSSVFPTAAYNLLYPQEWRDIKVTKFGGNWNSLEIYCDANGVRFLKGNPHPPGVSLCNETANYLRARGLTVSAACYSWSTSVTYLITIPRRS